MSREPTAHRAELAPSHRALVERAIDGELDAITELLRELHPLVRRTVRAILGAGHRDVDDVAQQAFVALIRSLPHFRMESSLSTYASRLTTRAALSARRREQRREAVHKSYAEELGGDVKQPTEALTHHVRALLGELSEEQAEALALRTVLGFSIDEIAAMTEVPRNTVKSRLRLAKAALRERVESARSAKEAL